MPRHIIIIAAIIANTAHAQERQWIDAKGRTCTARLASFNFESETIVLRCRGRSKTLCLPLRSVCADDQIWVLTNFNPQNCVGYDKRFHVPVVVAMKKLAIARKNGDKEEIEKQEIAVAEEKAKCEQMRQQFVANVRAMRSAKMRASTRRQAANIAHANAGGNAAVQSRGRGRVMTSDGRVYQNGKYVGRHRGR